MSLLLYRIPALFSGKTHTGRKKPSNLRPDIQGLRAFAVIAVILDHTFGWPSGGFVGVDIFFVISGFVITASLLREHDRTGRISFAGFYQRRVKRILPAAVLVLLVTTAAGFFVFNQSRALSTAWDALWAFFFSANWRQAVIGTDYFQASGPVSPLQHYWSLSVEEQFYFVWPWLMVLLFAVTARVLRGRGQERIVAGVAMSIIVAASFAWSVWETTTNPTVGYFSTFSRAWELGTGGILACIATVLPRIPLVARPVLAWAGMAGMVVALFVTDAQAGFPGPGAALSVLSAAMFIAAGTGASSHRYMAPLTNRVATYLGDISYSLYLWHFPVIIIGAAVVSETSAGYFAVVLAIILVISIYSYHLLEDPVRKKDWTSNKLRGSRPEPIYTAIHGYLGLSALAVIAAGLVAVVLVPPATPVSNPVALRTASPSSPASASQTPALDQLSAELALSVGAKEWPESMDSAVGGSQVLPEIRACGEDKALVQEDQCTWGDPNATKTAVTVGDSMSMGYVDVFREVLGSASGWQLKSYGTFGCSFFDLSNTPEKCAERKDDAVQAIQRIRPDIVFITNNYVPINVPGTPTPMTPQQRAEVLDPMVEKLNGYAKKIVFIAPAPVDKDVAKCYSKLSSPSSCVGSVTELFTATAATEMQLAGKYGADLVSSVPWFCVSGSCPSFVGEVPVKQDYAHPTPEYQKRIAPVLREQLASSGILTDLT